MSTDTADTAETPAEAALPGLDLRPRLPRDVPIQVLTDREVADALQRLKEARGLSVSTIGHQILRAALIEADAPATPTPTEEPTA